MMDSLYVHFRAKNDMDGGCHIDNIVWSHYSSLDVVGYPLSLGGVVLLTTVLERIDQVSAYDFVGCLRNVSVDGRLLLTETPFQVRFTIENINNSDFFSSTMYI